MPITHGGLDPVRDMGTTVSVSEWRLERHGVLDEEIIRRRSGETFIAAFSLRRMDMLLVGVELEVQMVHMNPSAFLHTMQSILRTHNFLWDFTPEAGDTHWGCGHDSSTSHCVEFRSPPMMPDAAREAWKPVLHWIKTLRGNVNNCCGIHVHVSDPNRKFSLDRASFIAARDYRNRPNKTRTRKWVKFDYDADDPHHNAICHARRGQPRLEIRLFNGSLNYRHMCRSIRAAVQIFEEAAMNQ